MRGKAFTLIELILVMAVLTVAVSITAPALARFFRGRTLDSEARRLLSLTRQGQSRAVAEGLPMDLWLDTQQGAYGLESEPSYEMTDPKAGDFALDRDIQLQVVDSDSAAGGLGTRAELGAGSLTSSTVRTRHPNLPTIRFLPDGTLSHSSPQKLRLTARDGASLWLALSRNRLSYEIHTQSN